MLELTTLLGCVATEAMEMRHEPRGPMDEPEYRKYRRSQIAELADWHPGFDMTGVAVNEVDRAAGSPKDGDKIARNPANHEDRWLIAAAYFAANFAANFEPANG